MSSKKILSDYEKKLVARKKKQEKQAAIAKKKESKPMNITWDTRTVSLVNYDKLRDIDKKAFEAGKNVKPKSKKIRWTNDLLRVVDVSNLDKNELRRAYNFAAHRANDEIVKLKEYQQTHKYTSPALEFIEDPTHAGKISKRRGQGVFDLDTDTASIAQLRAEVNRLKHFLNLETSSLQKTKDLIERQREQVIETGKEIGIRIDPMSITDEDLSEYYRLFRESLENKKEFSNFDSTQLKESLWEEYIVKREYDKNGELIPLQFSNIVDDLKKTYEKNYLKKQDEREALLNAMKKSAERMRQEGRMKGLNSSQIWEGILNG